MPPLEIVALAIAVLLSALLVLAAASDVWWRRIPNVVVVGVLVLAGPWLYATGVPIFSAIAAGLIALVAGYLLFLLNVLGAGDAKLFASLAICAGFAQLATLTLATAVAGGVLACAYLLVHPRRAFVALQLRGKGDPGRGLPYGVAIAIGGAFVLWRSSAIAL